jgi:TRAP-type C4-dicarboxylate transport system permease small subunit
MMGWKEWVVGALLVALCLVGTVASAAPQCGLRASVLEQLADRYGEARAAIGIAANGMVMELFAITGSQSWTITVTTPQGQTCLVASGTGYEALAEVAPPPGEDG